MELDYDQRTFLEFDGVADGEDLIIDYIEKGKVRVTRGIMKVIVDKNKFSEKFSQTTSSARRCNFSRKDKIIIYILFNRHLF